VKSITTYDSIGTGGMGMGIGMAANLIDTGFKLATTY
jgi:3-hydroxyisobutyrate dehydrogenase-like beta-hydroxyacid dehydrogenase